ncbi:MAG: hypothetical protein QOE60_239, partial [Thermoleophilaceae bacterium]|nr:hypothetical protein [Thermoleophilaceae bacterium]
MKVSLLVDGDCSKGVSPATRYREMVAEAVLADELGFHSWGIPEQHFAGPDMTTASQDALLATVASRTERLRIRFEAVTAAPYNHPIQVVERVSMMDNLTDGRAELAFARGNSRDTMEAFGVNPGDTREILDEMVRAVAHIFSTPAGEAVEWHGKHWDIPAIGNLWPRPLQEPYPPMFQVASSLESAKGAGQKGVGALMLDNFLGWDYIDSELAAVAEGRAEVSPVGTRVTEHTGFYCPSALCAPTREQALEDGAIQAVPWVGYFLSFYRTIYKESSYEYFKVIEKVAEHYTDMAWMTAQTPAVMVGTPDYITEQ